MKSGVPQRSVLGPVLFNLFINDLETGISSEVAKFADDMKLFWVVKTRRDCEELQKDLSKLGEWVAKWQMHFNIRKCKVMHIGAKNQNFIYQLMGSELSLMDQERDLGVLVDSSMKGSTQCAVAVKKANSMLGIILKRGLKIKQAT